MIPPDDTRHRLLEAAGEAFADQGFDSATVRQICQKAGANLAAVNYHFGDKGQLYLEAVREAHRVGPPWPDDGSFERDTPPGQLRRYVRHFLEHVLAIEQKDSWQNKLMLREMLRPSEAGRTLVVETIRPRFLRLHGVMRRLCPEADARKLDALCLSVVGQCLQYKMARAVTERIVGPERFAALNDLEFLTDHITGLTLAALGQAPALGPDGEPGGTVAENGAKAHPGETRP